MKKKRLHLALAAIAFAALSNAPSTAHAATHISHDRSMIVFKSPTCGCCSAWVQIMIKAGFQVEVRDTDNMESLKNMAGIPEDYWACHSAKIGRYIIEGHVPVAAIEKLLADQSEELGIAVPGMPMGAPGMGDDPDAAYDVLVISKTPQDQENVYMRIGQ